jgi:ribosomal protein S18 acetylase RimI-like enzyme
LLACAHVSEDDGAGYFGMFSVVPGLQGGGIGKQVLAECERIAREDWRLPAMRMTVIDIRDELIAFYERRGYRRTGILKPFPYGDERFGLPQRDDLRFEVLEKTLVSEAWTYVCSTAELLPGEMKVVFDEVTQAADRGVQPGRHAVRA